MIRPPPGDGAPDRRPRQLLAAGALVTAAGLAVAGTAPISGTGPAERVQGQQTIGGVVLLVGWALLAWGIHRFGRSGPGD